MIEASRPSPRLNSTFDEKRLDMSSNGLLRGWLAIQARELIEQIVVTHRRRDRELDKGRGFACAAHSRKIPSYRQYLRGKRST
jgi:hypothetical protein